MDSGDKPKLTMPSQLDAAVARASAPLADAGLTVVGEDLTRPWGGFLLIDPTEIQGFIRAYFPLARVESSGAPAALSPKILLVAPGRRLSWQYHLRRSEIWRIVEGPVGISRSLDDEETPLRSYGAGEILRRARRAPPLIGLETWGVVAEIWQHTDASSPSDEHDIGASPTTTSEPDLLGALHPGGARRWHDHPLWASRTGRV